MVETTNQINRTNLFPAQPFAGPSPSPVPAPGTAEPPPWARRCTPRAPESKGPAGCCRAANSGRCRSCPENWMDDLDILWSIVIYNVYIYIYIRIYIYAYIHTHMYIYIYDIAGYIFMLGYITVYHDIFILWYSGMIDGLLFALMNIHLK